MAPKQRFLIVLAFSLIALLISAQAFAGWVIEQEMSEGSSPVKVKKVLTFSDGAMRSDVDQMQMSVIGHKRSGPHAKRGGRPCGSAVSHSARPVFTTARDRSAGRPLHLRTRRTRPTPARYG